MTNVSQHDCLRDKNNEVLTDLRVVILRTLVGRRTGPLTRSCLSFARLIRSAETTHVAQDLPFPYINAEKSTYTSRGS